MARPFKEFPEIEFPDVLIDADFEDVSWHNDAAARCERDISKGRAVVVWCDYANPQDREMEWARYNVALQIDDDLDASEWRRATEDAAELPALIAEAEAELRRAFPTPAEVFAKYPNFSEWMTGGNCRAMGHRLEDGTYILVTDTDGCAIPTDEDRRVLVGHHGDEGPVEYGEEGCAEIPVSELEAWIDRRVMPKSGGAE